MGALTLPQIAFALLVGHALADFPLQGDFLAKAKNHRTPLPGVPWLPCLLAHVTICGGAVALATGSVGLGIGEALAHFLIDYAKNEGHLSFIEDQLAHLVCKAAWLAIIVAGLA